MRQKKSKYVPTREELTEKLSTFNELHLKDPTDEKLSRIRSSPEYIELRKIENFFHCRGLRRVNTSTHAQGLADLEVAGMLRERLSDISKVISDRIRELRSENSWDYSYLSPFTRAYQEDQKKFLISVIPLDLESFGAIYVYSSEQMQYLFHLAAEGLLPEEIAGMLTHHEVIVDPWIWKKRRVILDDERLAVIAAG
jgi:hypothetical protein